MANAQVCKTCIRGFDPRPVLQKMLKQQAKEPRLVVRKRPFWLSGDMSKYALLIIADLMSGM